VDVCCLELSTAMDGATEADADDATEEVARDGVFQEWSVGDLANGALCFGL
jgi:hypothetical protein